MSLLLLRLRLPTAQATAYGKKVVALRGKGCNVFVGSRNLVSYDQLLGKESAVTLIAESSQCYSLAWLA